VRYLSLPGSCLRLRSIPPSFSGALSTKTLSPTDTKPSRYVNAQEVLDDLVTPDLYTRTITLTNLTCFAIEDDLRELLAESGFEQCVSVTYRTRNHDPDPVKPTHYHVLPE
jgi:hypothetical protein